MWLVLLSNQKEFSKIPGTPIGFWLNKVQLEIFNNEKNWWIFTAKTWITN